MFIGLLGYFACAYGWSQWSRGWARCVLEDADGGCVVAGVLRNDRLTLMKLDESGMPMFSVGLSAVYSSVYTESVVLTPDGYLLVGYGDVTYSGNGNGNEALAAKLTSAPEVEWAVALRGEWDTRPHSAVQTPDGGYLLVGEVNRDSTGTDVLAAKLSADGSLEWAMAYGDAGREIARSVVRAPDGGYIVVGETDGSGTRGRDILVLKLLDDGSVAWARLYGGFGDEGAYSVALAPNGDLLVAGETGSFDAMGGCDGLVLRLKSDGSLVWARTYGGHDWDSFRGLARARDGFLAAGLTWSWGAGGPDVLLVSLVADGSLRWARTFGGPAYDCAYSVAQASDGSLLVAGYTTSYGSGWRDLLALRLPPNGVYDNCLSACQPVEREVEPWCFPLPLLGEPLALDTLVQDWSASQVSITVDVACSPAGVEASSAGVRCFSVPGGLLLQGEPGALFKIYSPDGRLVRSVVLTQGRELVRLGAGVYLWRCQGAGGKALVR